MVPVLTVAIVAALATTAAPAVVRGAPPLHASPGERDDPGKVRERTLAYEAAAADHRALYGRVEFTRKVPELLDAAQAKVGSRPGFWRRLAFPPAFGPGDNAETQGALDDVKEAERLLERSAGVARNHLSALEGWSETAGRGAGLRERLKVQRRELEQRSRDANELVAATRERVAERAHAGRFLRYWRQLTWGDAATKLAALRDKLEEWGAGGRRAILGAELTYVQGALTPSPLPSGDATPAYAAQMVILPSLEDTTQGREVELSAEVTAKAQQLATAKAAYEFVKNELRLDWYLGCLKGSSETLREGRGNDADLAALLIALLRAQGVPARYVRGTIEVPAARVAELMGLLTAGDVQALYGGGAFQLPSVTRDLALRALSAAGIPYEPVAAGGQVSAVRLGHVWVEAYIPYADYRGVGGSEEGKQWVPLDPSIPGTAKYAAVPPAVDALAEMGTTAAALTEAYLADGAGLSALGFYRSRVEDYLTASRPGVAYAQALRTLEQRREELAFIPGGLPYTVLSVQEESAFLPDTFKHRVRIAASDASGTLVDVTLPLHQVVGHRAVFAYKPATEEDAAVILLAGGLFHAPASIVEVVPVVRVDGRERAAGTRGVGLGSEHAFTMELLLPDGSSRRIDNRIIAGNLVALGVGGPRNAFVEAAAEDPADTDGPAARFLYGRAAAYANAWTDGEEEISRLVQVVPLWPTANVALVQYQLEVEQALGVRQRLLWKGLEVDADLRTMSPLELQPDRAKALMRLSGYEGSFQEARVLAEGTGEESVAAATVIQAAPAQGVEVLRITPANVGAELPKLAAAEEVRRDVADQVALGREVIIPAGPLVIRDWTGTGWIARDPATEEGGYFLSGKVSGGMTVVSPQWWTDAALAGQLSSPDAPASTNDLTQVARIVALPSTDFQAGVVGKPLAKPLTVYVTTGKGVPVRGAPVTFRAEGWATPSFAARSDPAVTLTELRTYTDEMGVAYAIALPDTAISHAYVERIAQPYPLRVGYNVARAETESGTTRILAERPFTFLGRPDDPFRIVQSPSNANLGTVSTGLMAWALHAAVVDKWNNPLANQSVAFTQPRMLGAFFDCAEWGTRPRELNPSDPGQFPSWQAVTDTSGDTCAAFIPGGNGTQEVNAVASAITATWSMFANPWPSFEFRVHGHVEPGVGIVGTSWPGPFGAQLRDPDGIIRGDESRIVSVDVWLKVADAAGNLLYEEHAIPKTVGGSGGAFDDDTSATFWPRYYVKGAQTATFGADVIYKAGFDYRSWHPRERIAFWGLSPGVAVLRSPLAGIETPASSCSPAFSSDDSVGFQIENASVETLYVRFQEEPDVYGEALVTVPPPDAWPRHPDDPSLVAVASYSTRKMWLGLVPGNHGGRVRAALFAPDAATGSLVPVGDAVARIVPFGSQLIADGDLVARLILPVRNFESAVNADKPGEGPVTATEPPIPVPATFDFCASADGTVTVTSGADVIAAAIIAKVPGGILVSPVAGGPPPPQLTASGTLRVLVPPGDPAGQAVAVKLTTPASPAPLVEQRDVRLDTRIEDAGPLPVGHTFVKDVSVADGHLVKQFEDLAVLGRGPRLALARTYTSRGFDSTPLGVGWSHSYHSFVIEATSGGRFRYMVVGGEGGGQVFTCGADQAGCTPQRGYHGALRGETVQTAQGPVRELVYRSKGGVEYRYGPAEAAVGAPRHRLTSIADSSGNRLALEYGTADTDRELKAVSGNGRRLAFRYERPSGSEFQQLRCVELVPGNVAVVYGHDAHGNLTSAARYEGTCDAPVAPPVRSEGYAYADSPLPALQNNLVAFTDPNGVTTQYAWYGPNDSLPGEASFLGFGDKQERVKQVIEPKGAVTAFTYVLVPNTLPVFGKPVTSYETRVQGPRPVVPETIYRMDPYGGTVKVERPLRLGFTAVTLEEWDPVHQRKVREQDARGRKISYGYDDFGNLVERRIATLALPASGDDAGATQPLVDGDGNPVAEVVERWAFDPAFANPVCHVDPEGRVTVNTVDSNGADPRAGGVSGTGLLVETRQYAGLLARAALSGAGGCQDLAAQVATGAGDIVTVWRFCGVNGACPVAGSRGDLAEMQDGEGHVTKVLAYDSYGNPSTTQAFPAAGAAITTDSTYDDRSRLRSQTDSLGHSTTKDYDGLDRLIRLERKNVKGSSPGLVTTFEYWPGGQMKLETSGLGLERSTALDETGRPWTITETGPGLDGALVTTLLYDEAGNKTDVVDRRGVRTHTAYDWGDRPTQVSLALENVAQFTAQGGELGVVGQNGVIATYGYDAAGNKVFETDLHGHRSDFGLDPLYRTVKVTSPQVPGASVGAPLVAYTTARRYDLAGNKVYEEDRNGYATRWTYDSANRVTAVTDPVGRVDRRSYDRDGNLRVQTLEAPEGTAHLTRTTSYDGLHRPRVVTEVAASGAGSVTYRQELAYDDVQHVVHASDRRGYVTTRKLDDLDRPFEEIVDDDGTPLAHPAGPSALRLTTQRRWDPAGNQSATIDPLGRQTSEDHDALGRVTLRTLPMGVTEQLSYDGDGRVVSTTDRRRFVRTTRYDAAGRPTTAQVVETLSGSGAPLTILGRTYGDVATSEGLVSLSERDAKGNLTVHSLDGLHREVRTVDAENHVVFTAYDAVNRRAVRDRNLNDTTYEYDAANRLTRQEELTRGGAVAYSQRTVYDDATRRQSAFDRRGLATVSELDGLGRVVQVTRGPQATGTSYDGNGNPVLVTDPNGHAIAAEFDGANRRVSETRGYGSPEASATTFKYDAVGNRVETKSARVTGVAYDVRESYDDLNRPVRTEDALGNVTTRAFDEAGNKTCEKRPLGNAGGAAFGHGQAGALSVIALATAVCAGDYLTSYAYDEQSKLVSVADALGGEHTFVYDEARNLVAKQDGNGNLTTYLYDALGRRRAEYQHLDAHARFTRYYRGPVPMNEGAPDPAAGTGSLAWGYLYDGNGNLTSVTDPKQQQVTSAYGVLDRLESKTWWYAAVPTELPAIAGIAYVYDGNGNLLQATERKTTSGGPVDEVTGRVFDDLDRLASETRYDGKVVAYGYDPKGNRASVTDPDGVVTSYTYDAQDRLETATAAGRTATYAYWPDGLPRHTSLPNGVEEGRCYDAAGRFMDLVTARGAVAADCSTAAPVLSRYGYGYDADGNRRTQSEQRTSPATQALGAAETTRYAYDALDRLVGVGYGDGRVVLYQLDPVGNRTGEREVQTAGGAELGTYASPPAGTLARDVTAGFNRADWLLTRTDAVDGTRSATYGYDLAGNQTSKTTSAAARTFAWDGRNTLTAVYENGVEVGRYDYDRNLQRVKRRTSSEAVEYVLDDRFVLQETDATVLEHPVYRRYHYAAQPLAVADATGFTFLLVDALGSVGDQTTTSGTVAAARQYDAWGQYRGGTAPSAAQPKLGFTGHQFDPETGLVYARARYYDAEMGRFLSRDSFEYPIGAAPHLHRFMYVRGNPLRYTDPSGHLSEQTANWAMNREWERYQAAPRGSPEGVQALQRYQFYRSEAESARNNRIFNEEVTFPLAGDAALGMVLGPAAKAYRVVRVVLGLASAASGVSDFKKASEEGGEQRTADIISGTGKVAGAGLMLAPEVSKGASAVVEKVRALGEKVRAAFTAVEDSAAPGAVPALEPAVVGGPKPTFRSLGAAAADDPALLADDSPLTLYRSMKPGENGQPATGTSGRTLGARPGAPPSGDIPVTDGLVHPDTGGMSVTPNDPAGLPPHRRPPGMGGTGKDPVYCMSEACLGERLKYRPAPDKPNTHGFVEPREPMTLEEYLKALSDTAGSWKKVE